MIIDNIKVKYTERSELLTYHNSATIIEELTADDTKNCIVDLQNIQFVILKPDAVAAGKAIGILEYLLQRGMRLVQCWPVFDFTEHQYEELYRFNIDLDNPKCMVGSLWCLRQQFESNPCIALLLAADTDQRCIYDVTQGIKGHFNPYHATSGTIRHDFHSASMSLNLIHMSDDPISSYRELRIFLTQDEIRAALNDNAGSAQLRNFEQICDALGPVRTDGDFVAAFLRTLKKLAFVIQAHAPTVAEGILRIPLPSRSLSPRVRLEEVHRQLQSFDIGANPEIKTEPKKIDDLKVAAIKSLVLLSDVSKWDTKRIRLAVNLAASASVQLSYWDRLLIESNAFYNAHLDFLKSATSQQLDDYVGA